MSLAKAKARANKIFIVIASPTIGTYNRKNIFIVQSTAASLMSIIDDTSEG
jgi:hypothetical protein